LKVYKDISEFKAITNAAVTTGTFDGVHYGHKQIINRLREAAKRNKSESVVLTFFPHPRMVLFPDDNELKQLNTLDERIELLEKSGVEHLIVQEFTKEFSRLSSLEFVRNILVNQIGTGTLVIGYDHRFGRNREGSFEHLKEFGPLYGFEIEEIPEQDINNIAVSSTKIRTALFDGEVEKANEFLGYDYFLTGTIIKGMQIGRTIGYPTANIEIKEKYKLIPADGVYAVKVNVKGQSHFGMLNIGFRPTVHGKIRTIEVYILNFDQDIYGQTIRVSFSKKIRNEQKFEGLEALKEQIRKDEIDVRKIFAI
jgi:riboflavin kinase / FMN adenylyltransferase